MSLLVVGSIAFDTIETQEEKMQNLLGGSASYFACAASIYTPVKLVGVVGQDFPKELIEHFRERGIDTEGLQIEEGETFRWWGKYSADMNIRETIETRLNVLEHFKPELPGSYRSTPYVFLGNGSPIQQNMVLDQMEEAPKFVGVDTMNLWIETDRENLLKVLGRSHALFLNDEEARMLTGKNNLLQAGRKILELGPEAVIIKKGEHGALMIAPEGIFATPAFPLENFKDPTGAGDSFGGGFMGYLAREDDTSFSSIKKAILHGTMVASYTVLDFGPRHLENLSYPDMEKRLEEFLNYTSID